MDDVSVKSLSHSVDDVVVNFDIVGQDKDVMRWVETVVKIIRC